MGGGLTYDYVPHWKKLIARFDGKLVIEMEVDGKVVERCVVNGNLIDVVAMLVYKYRGK